MLGLSSPAEKKELGAALIAAKEIKEIRKSINKRYDIFLINRFNRLPNYKISNYSL
jgi:hypothetical protein